MERITQDMEYFNSVLKILNLAESLGVDVLPNGTKLIGPIPHVAPEARLHLVFAALTDADIKQLRIQIGRPIPLPLADFYRHANGLMIFAATLAIHGMRRNYNRKGMDVWQPFDMVGLNILERLADAPDDAVFFGSYQEDGSMLWLQENSGKVFRCSEKSAKPLNTWPSFGDMLVSETKRLSKLFDENGREKFPSKPTTP